jgi:glycerol-3-phosphate acyltransferase PlsX
VLDGKLWGKKGVNMNNKPIVLSVDAMGGDYAPEEIVKGTSFYLQNNPNAQLILHGDADLVRQTATKYGIADKVQIVHAAETVPMDAKPALAMRRKDTSMWSAIASVKNGDACAVISAGNTGALMAVAHLQLRTIPGVHRPAIAGSWPNPRGGFSVVLDVGANVDSSPDQLVDFAIMGEAYAKALYNKERPSVGLLNVGSEDVKGHEDIKEAMRLLRAHGSQLGMEIYGFVEGTDISMGTTDVVVTDGFTGNIALKAAEGVAKLFAQVLRESLKSDPLSMLGGLLAFNGFRKLKERVDPRSSNGGVFLGLNGLVVKSHGGTDAKGFCSAIGIAHKMASSNYRQTIEENVARLTELRSKNTESAITETESQG